MVAGIGVRQHSYLVLPSDVRRVLFSVLLLLYVKDELDGGVPNAMASLRLPQLEMVRVSCGVAPRRQWPPCRDEIMFRRFKFSLADKGPYRDKNA